MSTPPLPESPQPVTGSTRLRPQETPSQRADRNWNELMQELRVMQTGTQILTGFLLAVAFQPRFAELDAVQRDVYVALVVGAATATVLALAPVGLHRMLFQQHRKPALVRTANRLVKVNLAVIGAVTVGVTALILDVTVGRVFAVVGAAIGVVVILALWIGLPLLLRRDPHELEADHRVPPNV